MSSVTLPCSQRFIHSRAADTVLIVTTLTLLVLGILATFNYLPFLGSSQSYFSYGMYGGAGLLTLLEIVKIALSCRKEPIPIRVPSPAATPPSRRIINVKIPTSAQDIKDNESDFSSRSLTDKEGNAHIQLNRKWLTSSSPTRINRISIDFLAGSS